MDNTNMFFERLHELMKAKNINQAKLCELTGLSSAQANYLANGRTKDPKLSTACKIALALDVSLDYLGGLIDEPKPIARDKSAKHTFDDPRQRDINDAFESVNEDGKQAMWTNSVMAKTTFPDLDKSSSVQEDVM